MSNSSNIEKIMASFQASTLENMHRNRLQQLEGHRDTSGNLSSEEVQYLLNAAPLLLEYSNETKRLKDLQESERKKEEEDRSSKPSRRRYGNIKDFVTVQPADKGTSGLGTLNLKYIVATADPLSPQYAAAHSALTDIMIQNGEYKKDIYTCPDCEVTLLSVAHEGAMVCPECGLSENVLGFSRENLTYEQEITCNVTPSFSYKRAVHLIEWLNQILGKETTVIPQDVIDKVKAEFRKARITSVDEINPQRVRGYLKKLNLSKFYEHSVSICQSLGVAPPRLSPETEEKIIVMFSAVQEPFRKYAPEGRSNFLSYAYCLYKFFQLLGEDQMLPYLPLLKSRQKLRTHDQIWKLICTDLHWEFIPTSY